MKEIAVYGKGGIGKSTICANLSAALTHYDYSVLQIGCDPKHDSTRLLTRGQKHTTVLDYMRTTTPLDYNLHDILLRGYRKIGCVEAGGPEPGVGCAGRGIVSTFEMLNQFKLKERYDVTVYDVLGDVVCGGFAVPIRNEYADTIFVVTSGEFMALYAANNILRGIRNYDHDNGRKRVAGIIYNKRNIEGEDERVLNFAKAVSLPICAILPRSDVFTKADQAQMTVIEENPNSMVSQIFLDLAKNISHGIDVFEALPLEDEELEQVVLGNLSYSSPVEKTNESPIPNKANDQQSFLPQQVELTDPNRYYSKNMKHGEPLHGCAFNGALSLCAHIKDAVILAHSPKSCIYISYQTISSSGRRRLFERGSLLPVSISPNIDSTEMSESDMIFGGMDTLETKIKKIKEEKPSAIIVVSACPAGIIGDDIDRVKNLSEHDMPIVTIKADGNMAGDYLQGMLMSYTSLARQIIKKDVSTIPNTVNIVFEKVVLTNTNDNFKIISGFLSKMDIKVNCRFLYETTYESLENFCSASLNLLAYKDYTGMLLEQFFESEYDAKFFQMGFPIGFAETELWLRGIGKHFGKEDVAEAIISFHEEKYYQEAANLKKTLSGKKLMIITYNHELDWILKAAIDTGIEIVKICILNFSQDEGFRTRIDTHLNVEENYNRDDRALDLEKYNPDILLTNYSSSISDDVCVADTIPMCPDAGFFAGLDLVKRWDRLLKLNLKGEWHKDEQLFKQHYSR